MIRVIIFSLLFFNITKLHCQESTASQQVSTFVIDAPQLLTQKKIWIYLPKNYTVSKKKYPVIYMNDAQNIFDSKTSFAGEWQVDETLDSINAQVIVVGIEHGNDKRIDELTPYKNEKYGGGSADSYLEFIVKTLKPAIDKKLRTKNKAKNTTIFGSSLGGLVSFYAILKYPKVFGKAGIFSPSFWFSKEIYNLTEKQKMIRSKIFFLCGDNESDDMVSDLNKMNALVSKKRSNRFNLTKKIIVKGGQHNEKLWREGFQKAYLWLK